MEHFIIMIELHIKHLMKALNNGNVLKNYLNKEYKGKELKYNVTLGGLSWKI